MQDRVAIVHYHEVGLKGRNRPAFEQALARNLGRALGDLAAARPRRLPGRIIVPLDGGAQPAAVVEGIRRVFGVANFALAACVKAPDLETLIELAWAEVRDRPFETFAVRARTTRSPFPLSGREINEKVGAALLERSGARVNLSSPELTCSIEIVGDLAFCYASREPGPGGLPVGASATLVALLSSGIDSPVAAARMMRRGSPCVFAHFHSQPFTDASSARRAEELAGILTRYQHRSRLWLVPLAPAQQEIVAVAPEPLRTILYRRMMVRIAGEIVAREHAAGLVTGDSLGQVASQTLENMAAVDAASPVPVYRPNVGRDKVEIIAEAQTLGTFEISSAPCQEACVLFEPKNPATRAALPRVEAAEASLDIPRLVREATEAAERRHLRSP